MKVSMIFLSLCIAVNVRAEQTPEMYFHPKPLETGAESNLIYFKHDSEESYKPLVKKLDSFLQEYKTNNENRISCDDNSNHTQACDFPLTGFGNCTSSNNYGYDKGIPCVFLSLEKLENWIPQYYEGDRDLPEEMPESTTLRISMYQHRGRNRISMKNIWFSCEGETPVDEENMGSSYSVFPRFYFPGYYFPYKNQPGYLSPLIAISFDEAKRGVAFRVRCKVWAKNIKHDNEKNLGTVAFDILID